MPNSDGGRSHSSSEEVYDFETFFQNDDATGLRAPGLPPDSDDPIALRRQLRLLADAPQRSAIRSAKLTATAETREHKLALRRGLADHCVLRVYEEVECTTLLISFCSLTEATDLQHQWIGTAKRAGIAHVLCLTDPLQAWYLRAATSSAAATSDHPPHDPFGTTLAIITADILLLQPKKIVCIGSSMGGYAATRCALALGAMETRTSSSATSAAGSTSTSTASSASSASAASTAAAASAASTVSVASTASTSSTSSVESIVALAFGPQIFIDPSERVALNLPWMSFDNALDRLQRAARAPKCGFALEALIHAAARLAARPPIGRPAMHTASVAAAGEGPRVSVEMHVGSLAPSDIKEARLMEAAVAVAIEARKLKEAKKLRQAEWHAERHETLQPDLQPSAWQQPGRRPAELVAEDERLAIHVHVHQAADARSAHRIAACLHANGEVEALVRRHAHAPFMAPDPVPSASLLPLGVTVAA